MRDGRRRCWKRDEILSLWFEKTCNNEVILQEELAFIFLPNYFISGPLIRKKSLFLLPSPSFSLPILLNGSQVFACIISSCKVTVSLQAWVNWGVPRFILFSPRDVWWCIGWCNLNCPDMQQALTRLDCGSWNGEDNSWACKNVVCSPCHLYDYFLNIFIFYSYRCCRISFDSLGNEA